MKVLDLRCDQDHGFEGWFASEEDFVQQLAKGLVECPLCTSRAVTRMPSAPRLNLSGARHPVPATATPAQQASPQQRLQALYLQAVKHVMAHTEDVGARFADEARRIHYGEAPERGIRGQADAAETAALLEEGIEVVPLPIPKALKEPLQ